VRARIQTSDDVWSSMEVAGTSDLYLRPGERPIQRGSALNYGGESVGADPQPSGKHEVDIRDEQMWVSGTIGASSS
jgi:hypothetical protein